MLELCALQRDVAGLNASGFELGLGLVDVRLGSDSTFEAIVRDPVGLFVVLHGIVEKFFLGVGAACFEVVDGKLGLKGQQDDLAIPCACLRFFARGAYGATNTAPHIDLIVQVEWKLDVAYTVAACARHVEVGLVGGFAHSAG